MRAPWLFVGLLLAMSAPVFGASFTVNSTVDAPDAIPGDGVCATLLGECTLRAALDEANALPGIDGIGVPAGTFVTTDPLEIEDDVGISGAGPTATVIDGGGTHLVFQNDSATASFVGLTIRHGHSSNAGAGIVNGGTLTLRICAVSGNTANNAGAGILNIGSLHLFDTTVSGNTAGNAVAGVENDGQLEMYKCTVSGNSVGNACAGIENTGTATLTNVTVSGNHAGNSGGGICNQSGGTLDLAFSTVTLNSGGGGAVENEDQGSLTTIANSIVSGNGNDIFNDAAGTITLQGRVLAQTTIGNLSGPGSVIVGPPGLGSLQNNGGNLDVFTLTHAPLSSSLAIDAAMGDCPGDDQRYVARPQGVACDLGAVEGSNPPCPRTPRTDCRQPIVRERSTIKLRDQLMVWNWSKGGATTLADFGDPLSATDYRLCVYDRPIVQGNPVARLVRSPFVRAGGACGAKPCWKSLGAKGFRYHDAGGNSNGIVGLQLRPGADGQAVVKATGKGTSLGAPLPLPFVPQVTVQLLASNGQCWDAEYLSFIKRNGPIEFQAKNGSPSGAFLDANF